MSQDIISITESQSVTIKMGKPLTFNFCLNEPEVKTEIIYYTIYKTTNTLKEDGDQYQFYVGKHKQYDNLDFDDYYGSGSILEEQIKEHGKENFEREFIEFCSSEKEMDLREIYWIATTSANCIKYPNCCGMNKSDGGEFYIGNSMKGKNHPLYGKPCSKERKENISNSLKGKFKGEKNPNYGKKHPQEIKNILSEQQKGKNNGKCKYIFILSNNEDFYEYFTINQRDAIHKKFKIKNSDVITFNDITITRIKKDKIVKEDEIKNPQRVYEYILSNGEDYFKFYNISQRNSINQIFRNHKSDTIIHKGIMITRIKILKDKGENQNG